MLAGRKRGGPRARRAPLARRVRVLCDHACVVEEGPDIRWNAYDTNHFITQTAVAPRFVRAAAKLHLRKIVDRLAREYGLGEDQMGVECVFADVFPLETVGGAQ